MTWLLTIAGFVLLLLSLCATLSIRANLSPATVKKLAAWGRRNPIIILKELGWKAALPLLSGWGGVGLLIAAFCTSK